MLSLNARTSALRACNARWQQLVWPGPMFYSSDISSPTDSKLLDDFFESIELHPASMEFRSLLNVHLRKSGATEDNTKLKPQGLP
jgi:hypothetical protein